MPTYVYECKSCHTTFEADQSIKDDPLDTCICGSVGTIKRVIQPVGIAFKGSGFYVNDSQKSAPAATSPVPESETSPEPGVPKASTVPETATPATSTTPPTTSKETS
jgi:putative FmdB family regulatory protein